MNILSSNINECCVGCGICVSCCPSGHLKIEYDLLNRLNISATHNKCIHSCNICLSVCPFSNQSENEDTISSKLYKDIPNIKYHAETGYYLKCYVGYHPNDSYRLQSSSGGLTTYLLSQLLEMKEIDAAIVVTRNQQKPYFSYTYCTSFEDIYNYSRSAYYAIHVNDVINEIIANEDINKIAVVALPCLCKALRNACKKIPKLNGKIKYIIGLVCGQQKTHNFSTYLAKKNQIENLSSIIFRTKKPQRPNGNFGVVLKSPTSEKEIIFSSYAKAWSFRYFTVTACNYCDDIFAETADIALMDAWLPQYKNSTKGENLVLCRNERLNTIIQSIPTVKDTDINQIRLSQEYIIADKRKAITVRLRIAAKEYKYIPKKREELLLPVSILEYMLIKTKHKISTQTDRIWMESSENLQIFQKEMRKFKVAIFISLILNKIHLVISKIRDFTL